VTPMSTRIPSRLVVDVQHGPQERKSKRSRRPRGRWIWAISGTVMIAVVLLSVAGVFANAGKSRHAISAFPVAARTVTITAPVTSVNVQSYGGDIRVIGDPGATSTQVTEGVEYDPQQAPAPTVTNTVSNGQLTLTAPSCATFDCSVGFIVDVPSGASVTTMSDGGNVYVSGVAGATIDSGSGSVLATSIAGPLTVTSGGGDQQLAGIAGTLKTDSGSGDVLARGITGPAATIVTDGGNLTVQGMAVQSATLSTGGGSAGIRFTSAPVTADVTTDGGNATVLMPGGPYALTADSGGGPENVSIPTSPGALAWLTVVTGGGSLAVLPASSSTPASARADRDAFFTPDQNAVPEAPPVPPAPAAP
jgi:hypothetical protein